MQISGEQSVDRSFVQQLDAGRFDWNRCLKHRKYIGNGIQLMLVLVACAATSVVRADFADTYERAQKAIEKIHEDNKNYGQWAATPYKPKTPVAGYSVKAMPGNLAYPLGFNLSESQEKRGIVWLDNHHILVRGFQPGKADSHGLYVWDVASNTVSQYSTHTGFCYADRYINAFGPPKKIEGDQYNAILPVKQGYLGKEKDDFCDSRNGNGCRGNLNMSCRKSTFSSEAHRLPKWMEVVLELREGDGAIVNPVPASRSPKTSNPEINKEYFSKPLLLVSTKSPKGVELPITQYETVLKHRTAYSAFAKRYVLLTQRPIDGTPQVIPWPDGRSQPVFLMNSAGDVESLLIPANYPDWSTIHLAMPAVPGLVFGGSGTRENPGGGLFLYDRLKVSYLDIGRVDTLAVSPDGCKVAYAIDEKYGKASLAPLHIKSIRFCTGEIRGGPEN